MFLPVRLNVLSAFVLGIGSFCISVLFLGITMVPGVFMFETSFSGADLSLNNGVGNFQGLTQVSVSLLHFLCNDGYSCTGI